MTRKAFVLITLTAIGTACTTIVDFDIPLDKPWVVVNSLFSPDSVWQVHVSYSRNILDSRFGSFDPVRDAEVNILDQNDHVIETLSGSPDRFFQYTYKGKTKPTSGEFYSVQVKVKDKLLKAASLSPIAVPITSLDVDSSAFKSQGEAVEMSITFKDPGETKNFYEVKVLRDGFYVYNQDTIRYVENLFVEPVDPAMNNDNSNGASKLLKDNLFNGKNYVFRIKLRSYRIYPENPPRVRVVLQSVTEEYFRYFVAQSLQNNTSGDPFAQPVQIFTNIENGLGIFAGYSSSVVELK
ncbi:MAG: DUF4249 domain-containing protein [Bacteroidia bacterium]|nr:DUF4249 domain-containing protein [Bacteroidia bacterium]